MDKETREFLEEKFTAFDQRFDGVDQRFDGVDQRFNVIDQRFDGVDQQINAIDQRFDGVDQRFLGIDGQFDETKRYFGVLAEGLQSEIRQVAEGHQFLMDGQARIMDRVEQVERELGAMIKFSYA